MIKFNGVKIYLACGHTDMRKQIDGLMTNVSRHKRISDVIGNGKLIKATYIK